MTLKTVLFLALATAAGYVTWQRAAAREVPETLVAGAVTCSLLGLALASWMGLKAPGDD